MSWEAPKRRSALMLSAFFVLRLDAELSSKVVDMDVEGLRFFLERRYFSLSFWGAMLVFGSLLLSPTALFLGFSVRSCLPGAEVVIDAARGGKVWECDRDGATNPDREGMQKRKGPYCFGLGVSSPKNDWCSLLKPYGKVIGKRVPMELKMKVGGLRQNSTKLQTIKVVIEQQAANTTTRSLVVQASVR